jgi:hypothetical protein
MHRRRLMIAGLLITVAVLVAACGNGDENGGGPVNGGEATADGGSGNGGELSLEEYFQEIDEIFNVSDEEIDGLDTELDTAIDEAATFDEQIQAFDGFLDQSIDILSGAAEDMEALETPSEVAEPHDEFTQSVRDGIASTEALREDLAGASNEIEMAEAVSQFDEEIVRNTEDADAACLELQSIADENSIVVDLNCED